MSVITREDINEWISVYESSSPFDMVDVKVIARRVDYEMDNSWDYEMDDECKTLYIFKDM
jgi:hypothetical protein